MWKDLPYKGCVYFSFILDVVLIVLILAIKTLLPPVLPLLYGLPAGSEQLVPSLWIILAPASGIFITILNVMISSFTGDMFLKKTLTVSSAFVSLLLAIATVKIILLVGFF